MIKKMYTGWKENKKSMWSISPARNWKVDQYRNKMSCVTETVLKQAGGV